MLPMLGIVFYAALLGLWFLGRVPLMLIGIELLLSAMLFVLYWHDKRAAQRGSFRISEKTLLTLSVLGGWSGAVFAAEKFRHKTKKQSYLWRFYASIATHVAVLVWLVWQDRLSEILA